MCMYQTRNYCFAPECFGPNWSSSGEMANWGRTFSVYPCPNSKLGIDFPVMPFGLTSSPKIVAVDNNLYIYVRIFRICYRTSVKFGMSVCGHQYGDGCAVLSRTVKQHYILKARNALVNAFQCVKECPPCLQPCAYVPYAHQQLQTPPLQLQQQQPTTAAHPVLTAEGLDHVGSFCCISATVELRHCAVIQSKDKIRLWTNAQLSEKGVA